MSEHSRLYAIHSDEECERLELQARLANIQGHLRHLPIAPNARVLDAGCGSGAMSRLIARSFPRTEIVAVDVRQEYLDYAEALTRAEGIRNITFRKVDIFSLPFPDGSFDIVWSKYLLQWLNEPKLALAELKRITKPGGFVVSCDMVGVTVDHFPIQPDFNRRVCDVIGALADCEIGRKVAPFMIALGFRDVRVRIETDTIFTVIGSIDPERRWNCEKLLQSARPQLAQIVGSELAADQFIERLMAHYDDPMTCSYAALYFTRGRVRGLTPIDL
jgi:ubiquinone/menaquinone biosynthesis C-methylase UbiE